MTEKIIIAALYKFVTLDDYEEMRQPLLQTCLEHDVKGTLLLAQEGINGTIAGSRAGIDAVLAYLRQDWRLQDLIHKESYVTATADTPPPFYRMKVRLKKEIVTLGLPDVDPTEMVGRYVPPRAWNQLISDPDVLLIDTRNDYEYAVGTFQGAVNPETFSFREFPQYVQNNLDPAQHKKVAMFCTGGIRCEKATSYLRALGFAEVYHLQGGILKYLEEVPAEESLWQGECFVFDNRVTVNHNLEPGQHEMCFACKMPLSPEEMASPYYQEGVSCPHCYEQLTAEQKASFAERQKQIELARARGQQHLGPSVPS